MLTVGICVALAFSHVILAHLPDRITLRWRHTVEKIVWEEDYEMRDNAMRLMQARIRGFGAGMDLPEDATYSNGLWHYRPALPALPRVLLADSEYGGGYEICDDRTCLHTHSLRAGRAEPLMLAPCGL